jgi:predicted LPLAT superfamily acyltransferase
MDDPRRAQRHPSHPGLFVWIALRLGRPAARLLLYPICLYFLTVSGRSRSASRDYLARALGRAPGLADLFRHYHCFAACVLDRVYLVNNRLDLFDLAIHGEDIVLDIARSGSGCFLLGAHLGSFEVLRAVGRLQPNLKISMVMYEENARKINSVLHAINPDLAMDVIALGRSNSMIRVEERLREGYFVGRPCRPRARRGNSGQCPLPRCASGLSSRAVPHDRSTQTAGGLDVRPSSG